MIMTGFQEWYMKMKTKITVNNISKTKTIKKVKIVKMKIKMKI